MNSQDNIHTGELSEGLEEAIRKVCGEFPEEETEMEREGNEDLGDYEFTPAEVILHADTDKWREFEKGEFKDMFPGREKEFLRLLIQYVVRYKDEITGTMLSEEEEVIFDYISKKFPREIREGVLKKISRIDVHEILGRF